MKILVAGFKGDNNSAKILLDNLSDSIDKLYLENNKEKSVRQLLQVASSYDRILSFGQKPILKNKIAIEKQATVNGDTVLSDFDFEDIIDFFTGKYPIKFSYNAGTSYCNNLYYHGLKGLSQTVHKLVFMHIPMMKNIDDMGALAGAVRAYIEHLTSAQL